MKHRPHRREMKRPDILLLLLFVCVVVSAVAQDDSRSRETKAAEKPWTVSDSRSFMELFTHIEEDLDRALRYRDQSVLGTILAPEFRVRTPEGVTPRAIWLRDAFNNRGQCLYHRRNIEIRAFMGVAVVSFIESATPAGHEQGCRPGEYLIVDVWESNHKNWQVSARFMSTGGKESIREDRSK